MDALILLRLLRLASPALPTGAFAYSQGLEWAVEAGLVRDAASHRRRLAGRPAPGIHGRPGPAGPGPDARRLDGR